MVSLLATGLLVLFLMFLAGLITQLPTVAIAAILIFTGVTLVDVAALRRLKLMKRVDAVIALITSIGVVALGVLPGIMVGVFLSVGRLLVQLARPHDALLGRVKGSPVFHDIGDDAAARTLPGLVLYRFYGPLIFSNVRYFIDRIDAFLAMEEQPVRHVIVDARAIPDIDVTAAEELIRYITTLRGRGIGFTIAKAHLPLRESAIAMGLTEWISDMAYTDHLENTVAAIDRRVHREALD
jgi:SulP family sulfate permease